MWHLSGYVHFFHVLPYLSVINSNVNSLPASLIIHTFLFFKTTRKRLVTPLRLTQFNLFVY